MKENSLDKKVVRSPKQIRKRWNIAKIICGIGIITLIAGGVFGFLVNKEPYNDVVGKPYKVVGKVIDVHEQMDVSTQNSGNLSTLMYHLVINYDYEGTTRELILNEAYLTEIVAAEYVGEDRSVVIDTDTFCELIRNEFCYEFIIVMILGFMILTGALMFMYRFSNEYKMFNKVV